MVNVISQVCLLVHFSMVCGIYLSHVSKEWIVTGFQFSHQSQKKDSIFYTVWYWNWLSISELSKISFTKRFALQRLCSRCHPWHLHSVFRPLFSGKAALKNVRKGLSEAGPSRSAPLGSLCSQFPSWRCQRLCASASNEDEKDAISCPSTRLC